MNSDTENSLKDEKMVIQPASKLKGYSPFQTQEYSQLERVKNECFLNWTIWCWNEVSSDVAQDTAK